MFKIKWRNRELSMLVIESVSLFTKELAEKQVAIWQALFPQNTYYIEPA